VEVDLTSLLPTSSTTRAINHVVETPVRITRCQHGKKLVIQNKNANAPDPKLVTALTPAHQWHRELKSPDIDGFKILAARLTVEVRYLSRIHPLVFLAPDIQVAILEGRQPPDLTLDRLTKHTPMPLAFADQRAVYGFPATFPA